MPQPIEDGIVEKENGDDNNTAACAGAGAVWLHCLNVNKSY
jgi:hypothetical protein